MLVVFMVWEPIHKQHSHNLVSRKMSHTMEMKECLWHLVSVGTAFRGGTIRGAVQPLLFPSLIPWPLTASWSLSGRLLRPRLSAEGRGVLWGSMEEIRWGNFSSNNGLPHRPSDNSHPAWRRLLSALCFMCCQPFTRWKSDAVYVKIESGEISFVPVENLPISVTIGRVPFLVPFYCSVALWAVGPAGALGDGGCPSTSPGSLSSSCSDVPSCLLSCPWGLSGWDMQCWQAGPHKFWGDTCKELQLALQKNCWAAALSCFWTIFQ